MISPCVCWARITELFYEPMINCEVKYVRYILFKRCPLKFSMSFLCENHWKLLRTKLMCQVIYVRNILCNSSNFKVITYLLCQMYWELLRAIILCKIVHAKIFCVFLVKSVCGFVRESMRFGTSQCNNVR